MDKEQIASLALEVAHRTCTKYQHVPDKSTISYSFSAQHVTDFAARFLAAVREHESGEAVAWMDSSGHPKHKSYIQGSTEARLYGPTKPLFLHPQEEGYVLVPIEPTGEILDFFIGSTDARGRFEAVIQAAKETT